VETILDYGNIDIDDITLFQPLVSGNAVTYLVIDRGADGFGKSPVVQWGRDRFLLIDDVVMADAVQFIRSNPGIHMGFHHFQHFCCKPTGNPHLLYLFRSFYPDAHVVVSWMEKQVKPMCWTALMIVITSGVWYKTRPGLAIANPGMINPAT